IESVDGSDGEKGLLEGDQKDMSASVAKDVSVVDLEQIDEIPIGRSLGAGITERSLKRKVVPSSDSEYDVEQDV
ncbi:hypothetical protein A2U01_0101013, partial [Trifolium medium]|nr:hypothetical protein [Trifolium medium]